MRQFLKEGEIECVPSVTDTSDIKESILYVTADTDVDIESDLRWKARVDNFRLLGPVHNQIWPSVHYVYYYCLIF